MKKKDQEIEREKREKTLGMCMCIYKSLVVIYLLNVWSTKRLKPTHRKTKTEQKNMISKSKDNKCLKHDQNKTHIIIKELKMDYSPFRNSSQ